MRNISEKWHTTTVQINLLVILLATLQFTRYTVVNTQFVVKFVSIWSLKLRISKRPACCLKETLDSRAVVLSYPFSDLLFPTFNMHVDVRALHNLYGEWVQAFGAVICGIINYDWLMVALTTIDRS